MSKREWAKATADKWYEALAEYEAKYGPLTDAEEERMSEGFRLAAMLANQGELPILRVLH
jgi:hypothetical protein